MYNLLIGFMIRNKQELNNRKYIIKIQAKENRCNMHTNYRKRKKFYRHKYPSLKINHNVDSRSLDLRKTSIQVI